jgi:hypothetical protein
MAWARLCTGLGLLSLTACIGQPPLRTYTIARTAIQAAKRAEADRAAPEDMGLAEEAYRRGEFYFKNKDYSSASDEFEKAIHFAEDAENTARLTPRKDE